MGFITAEELKHYPLPVTNKQWELIDSAGPYVQKVIDYASQRIKDYLEKDIEPATYIERIRTRNRDSLMLNHYPIISLDDVSATDAYGYTRTYSSGDFIIDSGAGIIEWLDKYRNTFLETYLWTVEYTAGYSEIPGPIKHATALQAVQMLQPLFRSGTNFAQVELITEMDEQIVDLLERYRRQRIA